MALARRGSSCSAPSVPRRSCLPSRPLVASGAGDGPPISHCGQRCALPRIIGATPRDSRWWHRPGGGVRLSGSGALDDDDCWARHRTHVCACACVSRTFHGHTRPQHNNTAATATAAAAAASAADRAAPHGRLLAAAAVRAAAVAQQPPGDRPPCRLHASAPAAVRPRLAGARLVRLARAGVQRG